MKRERVRWCEYVKRRVREQKVKVKVIEAKEIKGKDIEKEGMKRGKWKCDKDMRSKEREMQGKRKIKKID